MKWIQFALIAVLAISLIGCSSSDTNEPIDSTPVNDSPPAWTQEKARAEGNSAVDRNRFPNPAQAKLMAKRGATLDAKRNLLEQVLGLQMSSQSLVRDMVAEQDQINAQTSGLIRNAKVVGDSYDAAGGVYTVVVELKLYDVWEYARTVRTYEK